MRAAVAVALLALAAATAGAAPGGTGRPTLRLLLEQPLTVGGRAFDAREVVVVRAVGRFGTRSQRVRTSARGTFRIRFRRASGSPCVLVRVTALGSRGSRATLRVPPGACPELGPSPPR